VQIAPLLAFSVELKETAVRRSRAGGEGGRRRRPWPSSRNQYLIASTGREIVPHYSSLASAAFNQEDDASPTGIHIKNVSVVELSNLRANPGFRTDTAESFRIYRWYQQSPSFFGAPWQEAADSALLVRTTTQPHLEKLITIAMPYIDGFALPEALREQQLD
jgi:hypothetical protein